MEKETLAFAKAFDEFRDLCTDPGYPFWTAKWILLVEAREALQRAAEEHLGEGCDKCGRE